MRNPDKNNPLYIDLVNAFALALEGHEVKVDFVDDYFHITGVGELKRTSQDEFLVLKRSTQAGGHSLMVKFNFINVDLDSIDYKNLSFNITAWTQEG